MRRLLHWGLVVGMALVLASGTFGTSQAAPSQWDEVVAAAKREGSVTVYSVFPSEIETALYRRFQDEYGISVRYVRVGGSVPTVQKFLTEVQAGQWIADVLQIWKTAALPLKDQGLVAKVDIPNGDSVLPQFRTSDKYFYTPWVEAMPIIYNADLVSSRDLPVQYKDLSDPKYKGKLISGIPENSANWIEIIQAWVELYGWDWIKQYASNKVLETTREVEAAELMARGERVMSVMSQSAPAFQMSQGAPLAFHWVRPIIVGQYALVVPAKAPHPNAARVFENFVLSEGHQVRWSEQIGTYSVLATVKPRRGFPPLTALRTYVPNLDVVMRDRGKIVDDYRKVMNAAK